MYKVKVKGQIIANMAEATSVKGSVNTEFCQFDFDESWEGIDKYACFKNSNVEQDYMLTLPADNQCTIPWEVLAETGTLYVGVLGLRDNVVVKPTVWVEVSEVVEGVDTSGATPGEPTPTWVSIAIDAAHDSEAFALGTIDGEPVSQDAPQYHNNSKYYSEQAATSAELAQTAKDSAEDAANLAEAAMEDAEAWTKGTRSGEPVTPEDPTYHNNAKYYAEQPVDGSRIEDYSIHGAQKIKSYTITKLKLTSQFQSEIDGKYTLPEDGIPGTDIADSVIGFRHWSQTSRSALAKEFDQSKAYKKGDYMFRIASGNSVVLMRAKLDISAGTPYNAANWDNVATRTSILDDLLARIRALEEAVGI